MEISVTKRFGRYEILGEMGRGAMGVVYKARDPQIDRVVALKTISLRGQDPDAEREFRLRFLNEAQAAGRLHHPGIVAVFDVGEDSETQDPYIVLEYVDGEALNRILARERKFPLERALQITQEIAEALDYAHEQGVTHRDIKPGNILITQDGHPKIADFGIAKLNLANLTIPGKLLGTPAYMAPEQLSGVASDGRSDLFSLGVILYAMVVGHSPFQGDSATTVCFKVANREPVPASALDLGLPRELDAVISRAMAKDPKWRYQCGSEFAEAVAELRMLSMNRTGTASRTGTRSLTAAHSLRVGHAVGLADAAKLVRAHILRTPVRNIALGLAMMVMLLIVGVQTKLVVLSHNEVASHRAAIAAPADVRADGSEASVAPAVTAAPATPAVKAPKAVRATKRVPKKKAAAPLVAREGGGPISSEANASVIPLSTVELAVRHKFKDATLSVWVDGKLALTRQLHGGTQRRLVVFGSVHGNESETLQVPAGKHVLRLRAQSSDQTVDLSRTISADLVGGEDRTLAVTFDKHNTSMQVGWQ